MSLAVETATPYCLASARTGTPADHSDRIARTCSAVSFLRRFGCNQGSPRPGRPSIAGAPTTHCVPRAILLTVCRLQPNRAAIDGLLTSPSSKRRLISKASSGVSRMFDALFPFMAFILPASTDNLTFSTCGSHSRLLARLSSLSKFLWLTSCSGDGLGPLKASQTSVWPLQVRLLAYTLREKTRYPSGFTEPSKTRPGYVQRRLAAFTYVTVILRNLPRLLTSYRPSYPGTGFQSSCSISNSFRWLCGLTGVEVTGASRTHVSLDGQAQKQTRPSQWLTFSVAR